MVTVTKENFIEASEDLLKHLASASFVAIDEEMSGISVPSTARMPKDDTCAQRYERLKVVPETYCIIQIGVCLFHKNPKFDSSVATGDEAEYLARPYNFFLFPQATSSKGSAAQRNIVLSPSSMEFLNKHGMDFNAWTKLGIGYVTVDEAKDVVEQFAEKAQKSLDRQAESISLEGLAASNQAALDVALPASATRAINGSGGGEAPAGAETADAAGIPPWMNNTAQHQNAQAQVQPQAQAQARMQLFRTSDVEYVSQTMAHLREWLDNSSRVIPPIPEGGTAASHSQLMLPSCNSFLRRALYEAISESYPSLILELGQDAMQRDCILVLRLTTQERRDRLVKKQQEAIRGLKHQLGFTRIYKALAEACAGTFDPKLDKDGNVDYMIPEIASKTSAAASAASASGPTKPTPTQQVPLIVHNGFMDLMFLMTHFVSPGLPEKWADAKAMLHQQFPFVFDTKCMAEEYLDESALEGVRQSMAQSGWYTTLGGLYEAFANSSGIITTVKEDGTPTPPVRQTKLHFSSAAAATAAGSSCASGDSPDDAEAASERASTQMHEAGYDAYMTGVVYYYLARFILKSYQERNDLSGVLAKFTERSLYDSFYHSLNDYITGKNKLFCWGTMYIMNLNTESDDDDDLLQRGLHSSFIYRVSGCKQAVKNRDIHGAIASPNGSNMGTLWRSQYVILWVDDKTFYVLVKPMHRYFLWIPSNTRPEKKETSTSSSDVDVSTPLGQYRRVASLIYDCLVARFGKDHVTTLKEYNGGTTTSAALTSPSLLSRITPSRKSAGGAAKRKRTDADDKDGEPSGSAAASSGIVAACLDFTAGLMGKKQKT